MLWVFQFELLMLLTYVNSHEQLSMCHKLPNFSKWVLTWFVYDFTFVMSINLLETKLE